MAGVGFSSFEYMFIFLHFKRPVLVGLTCLYHLINSGYTTLLLLVFLPHMMPSPAHHDALLMCTAGRMALQLLPMPALNLCCLSPLFTHACKAHRRQEQDGT